MGFSKIWAQPYNKINLIIAGLIILMFAYSGIFSPERNNHPVHCVHEKLLGQPCPTCGISHSFSAIIRGKLKEAKEWNRNGIPLFLFFFIQLIMRVVIIVLNQKTAIPLKAMVYADSAISLLLFLVCFRKLILFWTLY